MLLRRVIEHVKTQNWFAVALDFLIVVFGVFIGFQVDRLYEAARDRDDEQVYLQRIHSDIAASIESALDDKAHVEEWTRQRVIVQNSLHTCKITPEQRDDFANGLFHLGKNSPVQLIRSTLDELISSGRLGLIRNVQLRDSLNETLRVVERQHRIWPAVQNRLAALTTYTDQRSAFYLTDPEMHQQPDVRSTRVTWEELSLNFTALCNDEVFKASVSKTIHLSHGNIGWLERNLITFRKVKEILEAELGVTHTLETN